MNHLMIGIFKPYGQTCWCMPHKINKHLCGVVKGRWPSETFLHITDSFKILTMLSCCSREIQTVDWFSTGVNQCSQATTVPKTPFRRAALLCDGDRTDCLLCVFSACVLLQTLSLQGLFLSSLCLWVCSVLFMQTLVMFVFLTYGICLPTVTVVPKTTTHLCSLRNRWNMWFMCVCFSFLHWKKKYCWKTA